MSAISMPAMSAPCSVLRNRQSDLEKEHRNGHTARLGTMARRQKEICVPSKWSNSHVQCEKRDAH
eukprot:5223897-Prymnesium_polylepis.2